MNRGRSGLVVGVLDVLVGHLPIVEAVGQPELVGIKKNLIGKIVGRHQAPGHGHQEHDKQDECLLHGWGT